MVLLVLAIGCSDLPTGSHAVEGSRLIVHANLAGTATSGFVVEVSAPDIPTTLVFNLPVEENVARGTITLPAGSDRVLTARAFDRKGLETHYGGRTIQVRGGDNDAVTITLLPLHGDQPIEMTVGTYTVSVSPPAVTVAPGESVQLDATVSDADGRVVIDAAVQWASLNPSIAAVTADGLVTARASGEAQVVAVYAGTGDDALITVQES
jgi:hypothetical protein